LGSCRSRRYCDWRFPASAGGTGRFSLETAAVIAARAKLGRFSSAAEVSTYAPLPPDRLDGVSDLMIFG
jgi:hypothetical protein